MSRIDIELPMEPYGKKAAERGFNKTLGRSFTHDHPDNRSKKAEARSYIVSALIEPDILIPSGPIDVWIFAIFTCPKSQHRKRTPQPRRPHTKRPDEDNISKWLKDAGTGLLWTDDSQVVSCHTHKLIGAQGERPRVLIHVRPADDDWLVRFERNVKTLERRLYGRSDGREETHESGSV